MRAKAVLYTDSNSVMRMLVADTLCRIGHEVTVAATGAEMLEAMGSEALLLQPRFDVVLLGNVDPGTTGMDPHMLCESLRSQGGKFVEIPILALVADGTFYDRGYAAASGLTEIFTQPLDWPRLLRRIANLPYQARTEYRYSIIETEPEANILDLTMLQMMKMRRPPEHMRRILNVAIDTVEKPLEQLRQAYEQKDLEAFHKAMHILKGMAGQLGAVMIAALAERFGQISSTDLESAAPLLVELQALTEDMRQQLIAIRASLD